MSNSIGGNVRLDKAKELSNDLEANAVAYNEQEINLLHKSNHNKMSQMFNGGECEVRSLAAHNVHKKEGRTQEGGTHMLLFGALIQQHNFEASGKDESGLGRWVSLVLRGSDDILTHKICLRI